MPPAEPAAPEPSRRPLVAALRRVLAEPRLRGVHVDSTRFVDLHRQILHEKPVMRAVFQEFYEAILRADARYLTAPGRRVELGAGSSRFGELHPEVLSTDIKRAGHLRAVVDAQALPFRRYSVRAYYGIDCFHHFPDPARFFDQLVDLLPPGGGCVLIEPYHGPLARLFFERLFETERFDRSQRGWTTEGSGPMTGANQALSYVVFTRDAGEFARRYPDLELVAQAPLTNYPRYVLSGGLNFRSLVPAGIAGAVRIAEGAMAPLARWLALHHLIVLRKRLGPATSSGVKS
jgi:SAM-dependent methyltransferase